MAHDLGNEFSHLHDGDILPNAKARPSSKLPKNLSAYANSLISRRRGFIQVPVTKYREVFRDIKKLTVRSDRSITFNCSGSASSQRSGRNTAASEP